jgi:hypothetical protein
MPADDDLSQCQGPDKRHCPSLASLQIEIRSTMFGVTFFSRRS